MIHEILHNIRRSIITEDRIPTSKKNIPIKCNHMKCVWCAKNSVTDFQVMWKNHNIINRNPTT